MQPKSKTGSTEQRQTLFINVVSSEIEALFVEMRKELETEVSPSKEFTANVGSTYASHLEDIILERANIFFRRLRSFLGDNKDETVVVDLKKKVHQNVY